MYCFKKLYEDVSNTVGKVNGCRKNDLIATCQVLYNVHDEMAQCPKQIGAKKECHKELVTRVKTRLAEVVKNFEGSKCSRKTMEPLAATFRTILKLSDRKIISELETFSGHVIAAVPVCPPSLLYLYGFMK